MDFRVFIYFFFESLSQAILAGIILVGRLGVLPDPTVAERGLQQGCPTTGPSLILCAISVRRFLFFLFVLFILVFLYVSFFIFVKPVYASSSALVICVPWLCVGLRPESVGRREHRYAPSTRAVDHVKEISGVTEDSPHNDNELIIMIMR